MSDKIPSLRHIDASSIDDILEAVHLDGACVVTNALEPMLCEALLKDFGSYLDAESWGIDEIGYQDDFYGNKTKRLHGLFSKSSRMSEVLTHPMMLALARRLFVDSEVASDVRLSNAELMVLGSDQDVQMFHTDAASWHRAQQAEDNELLVSANYALTDFTSTNGATRVVPGSHRWESGREPTDEEICQACMPMGSALVYSGKVIHSGGANQEAEVRVGLYLGYIASWLRPIENHLITNRPQDIVELSQEAQTLLDVSPGGITIYA
jgi:ectoine hydroxylase-related dioxygenase (phytanoyl-CoA dioxygenase family)